ncbi:hypothetical protein T10_737 [Trichinella papuae]|uniref:Uncharacterized protein n=1 Tax=Trichinella papuae TaxID=268474 RepID=A0A0V1M4A7_9BILA|nr:hypothetical protein T10_737 [Trichinella papuae]
MTESNSQFDEISALDDYGGRHAAVSSSHVETVDDILKTYPKLIQCVDHLQQFIQATDSSDESLFKASSVVRQYMKHHRLKLRQTTLKDKVKGSKSGLYRAIGFIGTIYLVDRDLWVDSRRSPGSNMNFLRLINDANPASVAIP